MPQPAPQPVEQQTFGQSEGIGDSQPCLERADSRIADVVGAIATRAIMADLRAGGEQLGGPPPFSKSDRSRFLQALVMMTVRVQKVRT